MKCTGKTAKHCRSNREPAGEASELCPGPCTALLSWHSKILLHFFPHLFFLLFALATPNVWPRLLKYISKVKYSLPESRLSGCLIMGTGKKEAARKERQGKTGDGMGNVRTKGENFYRYVYTPILCAVMIIILI